MPQDAACPKCKSSFPVTEARNAFTVSCPKCDTEMTVEFKKPAVAPEAGQPPYDLLVKSGALSAAAAPPPPKKKNDEDDDPKRKGGSVAIVLLSGGFGLLFVLGGLGLTAWFLFFFVDTSADVVANINRPNNNQPNNQPNTGNPGSGPGPIVRPGPGPGPVIPPKPKDEFELRPVAGSPQAITPPALDLSTSQVIALPAQVGAVTVGGNGRYIIMHMPSKRQLICFDASKGTTFIGGDQLNDGHYMLAGGQNRLAALGPNNILSVFDLPGLQRRYDASGPPPAPFHAHSIAMGSATNGPLLACDAHGGVVLMDIGANGASPIEGSVGKIGGEMATPVRASANGKLFVRGGFRAESKTVLLTEWARKWRAVNSEVCDSYPMADGKIVLGCGMIVRDNGQQVGNRAAAAVWFVPAVSGAHFLRVTEVRDGNNQTFTASVHRNHNNPTAEKVVSFALPEAEGLVYRDGGTVPLDQHLFLIPDARMLVILNAQKNKLTMRKVDIK